LSGVDCTPVGSDPEVFDLLAVLAGLLVLVTTGVVLAAVVAEVFDGVVAGGVSTESVGLTAAGSESQRL